MARYLFHVAREGERQRPRPRRAYDRGCEDMRGHLVQRCGEPQDVIGAHGVRSDDFGDRRLSRGDRAGLVEQEDLATRELLERPAALDDDATPRRS